MSKTLTMFETNNSNVSSFILPQEAASKRLDQALAIYFSSHSRNQIQQAIKLGAIRLNGSVVTAKYRVQGGERIEWQLEPLKTVEWIAQDLSFTPFFEDESILIINKPAGWVVHPGAGNLDHTLVNALLYHYPQLSAVPRAGLIHRLDKETSGLLVVAKTMAAHTYLSDAMQKRKISRQYECIVNGNLLGGGTIDAALGRHPRDRLKRAVLPQGKPAITHYRVLERFRRHTHLSVSLETGRTHQIRVHMTHIRHPIVGDTLYGARLLLPPQPSPQLKLELSQFKRQALHACRLAFTHPFSGKELVFEAPLPLDMKQLLIALQEDNHDALS